MKSTISIFLVLIAVTLCFFGCSNIPDEPATTTVVNHSYANPYGEVVTPPANVDPSSAANEPTKFVETINDVEFVVSDYNVYRNSVASIKDIELIYDEFSAFELTGYADVEVKAIGSRKDNIRIGYMAYDKAGEVVRDSFFLIPLDGVKEGDVVEECPFDFPEGTVKVVFSDFSDK